MKTKRLIRKTPLAAAIGGILATSSPVVLAQDDGADTLEEIVVTATRRETSVLDVPYNISAVSGRELAEAHIFENADLMRQVAIGRRNSLEQLIRRHGSELLTFIQRMVGDG